MNAFSTRPIPVLKGKVAQNFLREAETAQKNRGTIDMSKKRAAYLEILKTAKLGRLLPMAFLKNNCLLLEASKTDLTFSKEFDCGDQELTNFFTEKSTHFKSQLFGKTYCFVLKAAPSEIIAAFTISNGSIHLLSLPNNRKKILNQTVPREKQMRQYPAVLIGRLGVDRKYQGKRIGHEILDFIKLWFIDPQNKTGCRYLIVEGLNDQKTLSFYARSGFKMIFSTEIQEAEYYKLPSNQMLKTRLLYFDLIILV